LKNVWANNRKGSAAVEFAVVAPVLVTLLLGSFEMGRAVMVQHTLAETARAGARVYAVTDNTQQDAQNFIATAMTNARISNYSVTFDPPTSAEIDVHLEPVTVSVSVPYSQVAWLSPWFMSGKTITGVGVMPADIGKYR
jgi:Flp pilus assembly protein TadG